MAQIISFLMLFGSFFVLKNTSQDRLEEVRRAKENFALPPLVNYSDPAIAIATLGQKEIYDDFISIWLNIELQNDHTRSDIAGLDHLIISILSKKPKLQTSYFLSCITIGFELGAYDRCFDYLNLGKEVFPNEWKIPFMQGYIALILLSSPKAAVKYLAQAEKHKKAPPYVQKLRVRIEEKLKYSVGWVDSNSKDFPFMEDILQTDPFFKRLFEIQKKIIRKN